MRGLIRILVVLAATGLGIGACAKVTPPSTPPSPPASEVPTASPLMTGPGWAQAAAERYDPVSPQWNALAHPEVPYAIGGSAHANPNGVTFTPEAARRWWDVWFAAPVNLVDVEPGLLPGILVLSAEELDVVARLTRSGTTLPKAPRDYNPLRLPAYR